MRSMLRQWVSFKEIGRGPLWLPKGWAGTGACPYGEKRGSQIDPLPMLRQAQHERVILATFIVSPFALSLSKGERAPA